MRRGGARVALLGFALGLLPAAAFAGAWVRQPGHAIVLASASYSSVLDPQYQSLRLEQNFTSLVLFAEIGLPWRCDLLVQVPFVIATNHFLYEAKYSSRSFGDARFQIDHGLFSSINLSAALDFKVPLYRQLATTSADGLVKVGSAFVPVTNFADPGNGVLEITPKLLFGHGFAERPIWVMVEVGYRVRLDPVPHGIYAIAESGVWVWPTHLAFAVYGNVAYDFSAPSSATRPGGVDAMASAYFAFKAIATGAPWVPGLRLLAAVGGLLAQSRSVTGFDVSAGIGYEY